jgi:hypothetical protein
MSATTITGAWRDQHQEPGRRADLLLAEMTTAEKCHQLTSRMPWSLVNADATRGNILGRDGGPLRGSRAALLILTPCHWAV